MRNTSKILIGIAVIAVIVGIGISIGWLGSMGTPSQSTPPPDIESATPPVSVPPTHVPPVARDMHRPVEPPVVANPETNPPVVNVAPAVAQTNLITDWTNRVDDILTSEGDDSNKVQQLLAMFPHLPEDGQAEVAEPLSNLVPDDNYAPLGQYLTDTNLSPDVLEVLFDDLLNRPNSEKLPLLLQIAQSPTHPDASDAKDLLELFLDDDYGTDWVTWKQKMDEWLKANPD